MKLELNGNPVPWDMTVLESLATYKEITGREVNESPTDMVAFAYAGYVGACALEDRVPMALADFRKKAKLVNVAPDPL